MGRGWAISILVLLICAGATAQTPDAPPAPALEVEPQALAAIAQVWDVVTADDNAVWPGWNARETPILLYLPGKQDLLLNHPAPPEGFVPADHLLPFSHPAFANAHLRNGETLIAYDGQNTTMDVAGIETLVLADPASNIRNNLRGLVTNGTSPDVMSEALTFDLITADSFSLMALAAHEAFHAYQRNAAPGKQANEMALTEFPVLSVENNLGIALEADALARALSAGSGEEATAAAREALALREWRRGFLPDSAIAYEDGTEFNEGLAKYVEYALTSALENVTPRPEMRWVRGFDGFTSLDAERAALISRLRAVTDGTLVVNNDPYGTAPVRFRYYYTGMAVAAALEQLGVEGWQTRIMDADTSLTELLAEALGEFDRQPLLDAAMARPFAIEQRERVEQLAIDGGVHAQQLLQSILQPAPDAPSWRIVLDYSALEDAEVGFGFTPFGITGVDADRTIFRMVPISGALSDGSLFQQQIATPLLHDRAARQITFRIPGERPSGLTDGGRLAGEAGIEGLTLTVVDADISVSGDTVVLQLEPASSVE